MTMKGTNSIQANQATMIAAFQLYLESIMIKGKVPKVLSVKPRQQMNNLEFEILIESMKEDAIPTE